LAALDGLARELGLVQAVGEQTRAQRLALFLIYARLAHQGSRLSAARWSEDHAVKEILQVGSFDEDDLYAALEELEQRQASIEAALAPKVSVSASPARAIYLYDVTSVYFEGLENELADFGYNRDGKKGKKQLVAGLLTDGNGEPISIQLYRGNTGDPPTFLDAVQKLKVRFGAEAVALVGDRGMIKRLGKAALGEAKFCYVTALTDPQIRALLAKKRLQLELFDEKPAEVELNGKRYVLRCNPQTQARERARRADQWARVQAKITARNLEVEHKPRTEPNSSLKQAQALLSKYRLQGWVKVELAGRKVVWTEDAAARQKRKPRIVYASSSSVYGERPDLPKREEQPVAPISPYAATKVAGELYASVWSRLFGVETVGLRYFNVFGPGQDPKSEYAAVIPRFILWGMHGKPLQVHGDGTQSRDFTYIDNVVSANLLAAAAPASAVSGKAYNVGCGSRTSLLEIIASLEGLLGRPLARSHQPTRVGDVPHTLADIDAAKRDFGYAPIVDFSEGLRRTVAYFTEGTR